MAKCIGVMAAIIKDSGSTAFRMDKAKYILKGKVAKKVDSKIM